MNDHFKKCLLKTIQAKVTPPNLGQDQRWALHDFGINIRLNP